MPALTGSESGPGASRLGLYEQRLTRGPADAIPGRDGRFGGRVEGSGSADGRIRIPHSEITRESILQRYRGSDGAERGLEGRTRGASDGPDLSTVRTGGRRVGSVPPTPAARRTPSTPDEPAPRGSVEAARRQREGADRLERLRRSDPARASEVGLLGRRAAAASDAAAQIAIGVGVGVGTGCNAGWFWNPSWSPFAQCGPHWNGCWGSPWWWWGSCGFGWPWWGFGFGFGAYYHHWGVCWNACPSYGYGYDPYGYSYSCLSPAPVYYNTVVYADDGRYSSSAPSVVIYEAPRGEPAAGEGAIAAAPEGGRVVQGEPKEPTPEVQAALVRGVTEYVQLGDAAFHEGRYSDAVYHYARAVEYAPDDGALYLFLSDALFATGDYHYAAYALRRSIELEPKLLEIVVDKHTFYGDRKEFDKQVQLAENYLNEHFLDDDARLVLAANYLFGNRPAQCADMLSSSFSRSVRETTPGRLILERAELLRAK